MRHHTDHIQQQFRAGGKGTQCPEQFALRHQNRHGDDTGRNRQRSQQDQKPSKLGAGNQINHQQRNERNHEQTGCGDPVSCGKLLEFPNSVADCILFFLLQVALNFCLFQFAQQIAAFSTLLQMFFHQFPAFFTADIINI